MKVLYSRNERAHTRSANISTLCRNLREEYTAPLVVLRALVVVCRTLFEGWRALLAEGWLFIIEMNTHIRWTRTYSRWTRTYMRCKRIDYKEPSFCQKSPLSYQKSPIYCQKSLLYCQKSPPFYSFYNWETCRLFASLCSENNGLFW